MARPIYIFAGGGTGGHLYPGLAVAERLQQARPDAGIVFACSNRPIDRRILDPLPHAVVTQPVRPLPRSLAAWPGFLAAWRWETFGGILATCGFASFFVTEMVTNGTPPGGLIPFFAIPGVLLLVSRAITSPSKCPQIAAE